MSMGMSYLPASLSVLGLSVMGYLSVKHRTFLAKALVTVIRKLTRSKR